MLAGCRNEPELRGGFTPQTLDAEKYQHEIAAVDQLLFRESPLGDDGVRQLRSTIETLSKRVGEADEHSRFLYLESHELQTLADRAAQLSPKQNGAALQNDWMRIRNNLFDDRAWFVRSSADLDYAAQTVPRPPGTLAGRWQVTSVFVDGRVRFDDARKGEMWTFAPPDVTIAGRTYACDIRTDSLTLDNDEVKYALTPGALRLDFADGTTLYLAPRR
jgi:hypothetical protein